MKPKSHKQLLPFAQLLLIARRSGCDAVESCLDPMPKRPTLEQIAVITMMKSLESKQQLQLHALVKEAVDLSISELLYQLQQSDGVAFELVMKSQRTGKQVTVTADDIDLFGEWTLWSEQEDKLLGAKK